MPSISLTQLAVDRVKAPAKGRIDYCDKNAPGFGLRVSDKGHKSWNVVYRLKGTKKLERLTLGTLADIPKVEDAREMARDVRQKVARGEDPKAKPVVVEIRTLASVVPTFIDRYMRQKGRADRYVAETQRIFDQDVIPKLGGRDIKSISRGDIVDLLDSVVDSGRPIQANRTLAAIRKLLNWSLDRGYIDASPVMKMTAPSAENSRERVLTADELRLVWLAAGKTGYPFGPMVQLLILTLQRRNEVAWAPWPEFDTSPQKALWALPGERAKNKIANDVPLSTVAIDIIDKLPRFKMPAAEGVPAKDCPWLFTTTLESPVSGFAKAKLGLDAEILKLRRKEAEERGENPDEVKPLPHWTFHDLRRTGDTLMNEELGIPPHIVEAVINHISGTIKGVARTYNRAKFLKPKRQALDAWAAYVEQLGKPAAAENAAVTGERHAV